MKNTNSHILKQHDMTFVRESKDRIVRAEGMELYAEDGKVILDFNNITSLLGHSHPVFIERTVEALKNGVTTALEGYEDSHAELLIKLMEETHGDFDKVFLSSSGSEAIDWAVRIARNFTRRDTVITFSNSLHGRTYLSANLSGIDQRKVGFGVQAQGIVEVPYPECDHCPWNLKKESCGFACIDEIDRLLEEREESDPAAVLIEPFIGSTGMLFPPEGYLAALRKWAKDKSAVFIFDEIQTGYGKFGSLFAYQRLDVKPDLMVIGKGMGNGLHIAGLLAKDQILTHLNGRALRGGTGHSALETAGAVAVLDIIRDEKWLDHVLAMEELIVPLMEGLVGRHDRVDNYRGCGVVYGIELVTDTEARGKNETLAEEVVEKAYHQGLRLGRWNNVLFFRPPIIVNAEQVHRYFKVLENLLDESG